MKSVDELFGGKIIGVMTDDQIKILFTAIESGMLDLNASEEKEIESETELVIDNIQNHESDQHFMDVRKEYLQERLEAIEAQKQVDLWRQEYLYSLYEQDTSRPVKLSDLKKDTSNLVEQVPETVEEPVIDEQSSNNEENVPTLMSEQDIIELINELECLNSIIHLSLNDILSSKNKNNREEQMKDYNIFYQMYVLPLVEEAYRYYTGKGRLYNKQQNTKLSIKQQIRLVKEDLHNAGYTANQLLHFVPRSVPEVSILYEAAKSGFDMTFKNDKPTLNEERLHRAIIYMEEKNLSKHISAYLPYIKGYNDPKIGRGR